MVIRLGILIALVTSAAAMAQDGAIGAPARIGLPTSTRAIGPSAPPTVPTPSTSFLSTPPPIPTEPLPPPSTPFLDTSAAAPLPHDFASMPTPDWSRQYCEGECGKCRLSWLGGEFLWVQPQNVNGIDYKKSYGFRGRLGHWFDATRTLGIDGSLMSTSDSASVVGPSGIAVDSNFHFRTADVHLRGELFVYENIRFDGLLGYRYLDFREEQAFGAHANALSDINGNIIHSAQIGLAATYRLGPYLAELLGKAALGSNDQRIDRNGFPTTQSASALIAEINGRIGYQVGEGLWVTLGYSAWYCNQVLRPGRGETGFLLHGLTAGFEWRF